jgi:hypothetical protein
MKNIIIKVAKALKKNVDDYGGLEDDIFYARSGDCYDGLCISSDAVCSFAIYLIEQGKVDEFCNNPDLFDYVERGVSCGNSSCLYFVKCKQKEKVDNLSVSFLNKIFDIINPDL